MGSPSDDLRQRAAVLEASGTEYLARARRLRELADEIDGLDGPAVLTSAEDNTIIASVASPESSDRSYLAGRGRSRAFARGVKFIVALYNHPDPKKRMSGAQWGRKHGVPQPTVSSWSQPPGAVSARPIPRKWAVHFFKEYGVPMSTAAWPNGIIDSD